MEKLEIKLYPLKIRDLVQGYKDNGVGGVVAYNNSLDVRPPYQREFVYKDKQRDAVIETVMKGFPLNVMYWVKKDEDDDNETIYEVLDGQQRTISICQYYQDEFTINYFKFSNLPEDKQKQFLDYELMVYLCEGTDSEKLEWFKTINIAGVPLKDQELRNSVYSGPWLTDAKRYFSRTNGPAYGLGGAYLNGTANRQDYLETTLKWISKDDIEEYMSDHQHDKNANDLWAYFVSVINWIEMLFPERYYRKEMKGQPWGEFYNEYNKEKFDAEELEEVVSKLMKDEDVDNKKGIYKYLFDGKEKHLNIRDFKPSDKRYAYERQKGICNSCSEHFEIDDMHADHIKPWSKGGKTIKENCQVLCADCNRRKSNV